MVSIFSTFAVFTSRFEGASDGSKKLVSYGEIAMQCVVERDDHIGGYTQSVPALVGATRVPLTAGYLELDLEQVLL